MKGFTNGAIDKVNVNELIADVCSSSNGGDDIDMGADMDSDIDTDSDIPRQTGKRSTYGESDFGGDLNSRKSVISLKDVLEEDDVGNENKINIGDHKISINSQGSRRKTNAMREGQNEINDSHDSDVSP